MPAKLIHQGKPVLFGDEVLTNWNYQRSLFKCSSPDILRRNDFKRHGALEWRA